MIPMIRTLRTQWLASTQHFLNLTSLRNIRRSASKRLHLRSSHLVQDNTHNLGQTSHNIHSQVSSGRLRKLRRNYLCGGGSETKESAFSLASVALLYLSSSFSALVHLRLSAVLCQIHQQQSNHLQLKPNTR